MRRSILWLAAAFVLVACAAPALATPVATNDATYSVFGRVFPDPLGGCQLAASTAPCSPHAQGNVPATQFIQWDEFVSGLQYLNSKPGWQRHMEVLVLDGKIGPGSGTAPGPTMFPGNDLTTLEFTPKPEYVSAGLPTTSPETRPWRGGGRSSTRARSRSRPGRGTRSRIPSPPTWRCGAPASTRG